MDEYFYPTRGCYIERDLQDGVLKDLSVNV